MKSHCFIIFGLIMILSEFAKSLESQKSEEIDHILKRLMSGYLIFLGFAIVAAGYVLKPFDPPRIIACVEKYIY